MKFSRQASLKLYNDLQMTRRESELDAISMRSNRDWTGGGSFSVPAITLLISEAGYRDM